MDRLACKRQVWSALSSGGEQDLHQAVWDVTLNELHSGSCSYRQALLDALDVTAVTDATSTIRLVQRHIQLAQAGSSQAQCFAGVLLSLYSPLDGHGGTHQHSQGFRYLLSSHYQHNNLATLFLALCYEAARGTERSVESALECYQTAFTRGYQIAHILFLESSRDHGAGAASKPAATSQVRRPLRGRCLPAAERMPTVHTTRGHDGITLFSTMDGASHKVAPSQTNTLCRRLLTTKQTLPLRARPRFSGHLPHLSPLPPPLSTRPAPAWICWSALPQTGDTQAQSCRQPANVNTVAPAGLPQISPPTPFPHASLLHCAIAGSCCNSC